MPLKNRWFNYNLHLTIRGKDGWLGRKLSPSASALIAASCIPRHPCWSWAGQWWWLELHVDLCTLCPDLCSVTSCNLWWWGVPSAIGTNTLFAHMAVSPTATCAGGVLLPPTGADTVLAPEQLALCGSVFGGVSCTIYMCMWWWL